MLQSVISFCISPLSFLLLVLELALVKRYSEQHTQVKVESHRRIFNLVHSTQLYRCTERWETLQNTSTVFQNKHLRVYLPQSIKIGLKRKWYDTFVFLDYFNGVSSLWVLKSFKKLLLTWPAQY